MTAMITPTPSGWYPDPDSFGQLRHWDGTQWSEYRSPVPPPKPRLSTRARTLWRGANRAARVSIIALLVIVPVASVWILWQFAVSLRPMTTAQAGQVIAEMCYKEEKSVDTVGFRICVGGYTSMAEDAGLNDGIVGPDGEPVYGYARKQLIEDAAEAWRP